MSHATVSRRTLIAGAAAFVSTRGGSIAHAATVYDNVVLSQSPKHYYRTVSGSSWLDVVAGKHGRFVNGYQTEPLPDGSLAPKFDGVKQYARIPDHSCFGPANFAAWTVTCWVKPGVLIYPNYRSEGYVHFIGKLDEWLGRIFNSDASLNGQPYRQGWLSAYVFDPYNGYGAGLSYQQQVNLDWYHFAFVVRRKERTCGLFLNGKQVSTWHSLKDTVPPVTYDVHPVNTTNPVYVGCDPAFNSKGQHKSWFKGSIGKPAFFTYDLSTLGVSEEYPAGRITRQAQAM